MMRYMNIPEYRSQEIEKKWQKWWQEEGIYTTPRHVPGKENFYALSEFAYPSGNLHVGHWYAFAVPDIYARFKRMNGYNVLYPIGFDAFGLPAENAAIKRGVDPREWTYSNMDYMKGQLMSMGASFDWTRTLATCDPEYYKWTQWMFNQFYTNDLVERAMTKTNWCESCKTILANEQVVGGRCERCDTEVVQKDMAQWMLKITNFADALVDDLEKLPWDESIKQAQREWIGRSFGTEVTFKIKDQEIEFQSYTTRVETIFSAAFIVIAPEHNIVYDLKNYIENWSDVEIYIDQSIKKSDLNRQQSREKTGVELKGVTAINPANNQQIPIWIADFVLVNYGTGIVFGDAHDERDFEFAKKFKIPLTISVIPENQSSDEILNLETCYEKEGVMINSGEFDGLTTQSARQKIADWLVKRGSAKLTKKYRLRDWGISRQRYWGCPIPIVYDPQGNAHAVPDEHLPWVLPSDIDYTPDGTAPLARSQELRERTERIFGPGWTPEVDTMDTFVDSSWYFYRYLDPQNNIEFASNESMEDWMPVDYYFGGAEHTTMHLLYSRFWTKALHSIGLVSHDEPYDKRLNRGLILGPDGAKMSKSKGNVIDPDEVVFHVGADTVRMYLAFIGPFNEPGSYPWDPNGVVGIRRFLERIWRLSEKISPNTSSRYFQSVLHKTIKKVTDDIERLKLNTAISSLMILLNEAEKSETITQSDYESLLKMLAVFAPHISEELWQERLKHTESIHTLDWPVYNKSLLVDDETNLAIQINGKVRGEIILPTDSTEDIVREHVLKLPEIQKWIDGRDIIKFIYVPGRIINIVV